MVHNIVPPERSSIYASGNRNKLINTRYYQKGTHFMLSTIPITPSKIWNKHNSENINANNANSHIYFSKNFI